jgi:microsomal dipeptidase-like Zn-dependent dipeptidase
MKLLRTTLVSLSLLALAAPGPARAVQGYVDLHSHMMAEYSFGGAWFWGNLEGPINPAVVRCDGSFPGKTHATTVYPAVGELLNGPLFGEDSGDTGWHLGKRRGFDERRCRRFLGITIPGTCPRPNFEGWPTWTTTAHQQMWQGWLQQAHQNGLQVQVVSLAESNFLCINMPPMLRRYSCDEMESVRRQALAARDFAARNSSWVGIATTAAEARALIAQGKLALVLSVEITKLFPSGDFVSQLDSWRSLGIRSVQVVHHADNRFGGAAQIPDLKKAANLVEGIYLGTNLTGINDIDCRDGSGASGSCNGDNYLNVRGLTPDGVSLVRAMMDRGMLLDVAHLSRKAFHDVYDLAFPRGYPMLYSHTHMWDTTVVDHKHEKYMRQDEIHMITDTGGMIGLRTGPEDTVQYSPPGGGGVGNFCQGSSRSFSQSLMYAVDHGLDVGFGADFNGFTRQMKPRKHSSCWMDGYFISNPTWFQSKGLGHVGLLPELMSDLSQVGLPQQYLDELNQSAEKFLQIWERSENLAVVVPTTNLARTATASATSTYCSSGGTPGPNCYSAARVNDGSRSTALGGLDSWANAGYEPMPQAVQLTWSTPVTFSRVDLFTTDGYLIRDYDIQWWNGFAWVNAVSINGNAVNFRSHPLGTSITTTRLRISGRSGPNHQPGWVRVNEIEVY